jgi:hypothetical protein
VIGCGHWLFVPYMRFAAEYVKCVRAIVEDWCAYDFARHCLCFSIENYMKNEDTQRRKSVRPEII